MRKIALSFVVMVSTLLPVSAGFAQTNSNLWSYETNYGTYEFKTSNVNLRTTQNPSNNSSLAIKEGDQIQYSFSFSPKLFDANELKSCLAKVNSGIELQDISLLSNFLFENGEFANLSILEFSFAKGEILSMDTKGNFSFDSTAPIQFADFALQVKVSSFADNDEYLKCFDVRTVNIEIKNSKVLFEYHGLLEQSIKPLSMSNINLSREGLTLPVTSSSGLKVIVETLTPRVCEVYQRYVTLIKAGRCALGLSQPGDSYFFPAENEVIEFLITSSSKKLPLCIGPNQVLQLKVTTAKCPTGLVRR